jgi:NADH-quinone oxidoreductase subunit N
VTCFVGFNSQSRYFFLFLAFFRGSVFGLSSAFFYLVIYLFIVFSIWSFFFCFFRKQKSAEFGIIRYLNDFRFLFQENPALAVFCVVFLFSISGLPPLAGFYLKMFVFCFYCSVGSSCTKRN